MLSGPANCRGLAFSLVAIAVAVVLATKELLLCVWGAILRSSGKAFQVGDRIELQGARGDVIDHGLLSTTILEIGPGQQQTGRILTVPNSVFLTTPVTNETFTDAYVLHVITVPMKMSENWESVEQALLQHAREACAGHVEAARKHMTRLAAEHGLTAPTVEPRVIVHLPEPERLHLLVRVPTAARERGRTEQQILRAILASHGDSLAGA